jgi:hypothetical protein
MTVQPLRSCQLESDQKAFTLNPKQSKPETKRRKKDMKKKRIIIKTRERK